MLCVVVRVRVVGGGGGFAAVRTVLLQYGTVQDV